MYDANNVLIKMTDDGSEQPLVYNAAGQPTAIGQIGPNQDAFTFTYDAGGNLTDAVERSYDGTGKLFDTQNMKYTVTGGRISQTAVYNAANKLVNIYTYTYDANGTLAPQSLKMLGGY